MHRVRCSVAAAIAVSVLATSPAAAQCQGQWLQGDPIAGLSYVGETMTLWDPDGAGPSGPLVVVGGRFSAAGGVAANHIAAFNPATGQWQPFGTGMNSWVHALAVLPDGRLVAGGEFTQAGTVAANRVAVWNGASWSPLGHGLNDIVYSLAVDHWGALHAGGSFLQSGTTSVARIARWSGSSWVPLGAGTDGPVHAMISYNGELVAGGDFQFAGGTLAPGVAAWNGSTWRSLGSGLPTSVNGSTRALIVQEGFLYGGGNFESQIGRWNGGFWQFILQALWGVRSFGILPTGELVAGGETFRRGTTTFNGPAVLRNGLWYGLGPEMINGLARSAEGMAVLPDGSVYMTGHFQGIADQPVRFVARWDGGEWERVPDGNTERLNETVTLPSGEVVASLYLSPATLGGTPVGRIARWDGRGWSTMGTAFEFPSGIISGLAVLPDGTPLASGQFLHQGVETSGVARWNGTEWEPFAPTLPWGSSPGAMAVGVDGTLYGASINRVASFDGSVWTPLGEGSFDGGIYTLCVLPTGEVVAAGDFEHQLVTFGQFVPMKHVAKWDGSAWAAMGAGLNDEVWSVVATPDGRVFAGGEFTQSGSTQVRAVARWDGQLWQPLGSGLNQDVRSLAVDSQQRIIAVGRFTGQVQGAAISPRIARWNGAAWESMGAGLHGINGGEVIDVGINPQGEVIAVGDFARAGGVASGYFARWSEHGVPWVALKPQPASVPVGQSLTLHAAPARGYDIAGPLSYHWERNGAPLSEGPGGASSGGGTVIGSAGQLSGTQVATLVVDGFMASDAGEYRFVVANACGQGSASAAVSVATNPCPPDLTTAAVAGSPGYGVPNGILNNDDFFYYLTQFAAGNLAVADLTTGAVAGQPGYGVPNGIINNDDFFYYLAIFAAGC